MAMRWYVVQSKINQEHVVIYNLKDQGFNIYYPTYVETTLNKKNEPIKRTHPLFPSYLFVQFDVEASDMWKRVGNTRGVQQLVGQHELYVTPLPHGVIEEIMSRQDENGHVPIRPVVQKILELKEGMQLKVRHGSMAGAVGTLCNHYKNRVTLLLTLLGTPIRAILKVDDVTDVTDV